MPFRSRLRSWPVKLGLSLILVAVLLGLIVHTGLIREEDLEVLDEFVEHRHPILTSLAIAVTNLFSPLVAVILGVCAGGLVWTWTRRFAAGAYIWLSVAVASGITFLLKLAFQRQRPPELTRLVIEQDFGYPSGHTTSAAALVFSTAFVIALHRRHPRRALIAVAAAFAVTVLIAATRLYLGIHWFTDTFAGAFVGIGAAMILAPLVLGWAGRSADRRAVQPSTEPTQ